MEYKNYRGDSVEEDSFYESPNNSFAKEINAELFSHSYLHSSIN